MMVYVNHEHKMREAWDAAISAMMAYQHLNGPLPDFDKWLAEQNRNARPIVRG